MDEFRPVPGGPLENKPERTVMLRVICVLTFIGSGMSLFSNVFFGLFYDTFLELIDQNPDLFGKFPGLDMMLEGGSGFFLLSGVFYAGSLAGAWMMWKLRKAGFHLYTISQIILILIPMVFLKLPGIPWGAMIISGSFVFLYSINLKYMH